MDPEKFVIQDELLTGLVIRNGYLDEERINQCLQIQQKLAHNQLDKNLEEILFSPKVLLEEQLPALQHFVRFCKIRLAGIIYGQLAVERKLIGKEDLERALISQRAIFLLKNEIVPFEEILQLKQILPAAEQEVIAAALNALPAQEYGKILLKATDFLEKEDQRACKWRNQHLHGIIGVKYTESAPESFAAKRQGRAGLLGFLKKSAPEPEDIPPSRFEKDEHRPTQAIPKVVAKHPPPQPLAIIEEVGPPDVPPSKLETNPPPPEAQSFQIEAPSTGEDIDATEAIPAPLAKSSSSTWVAFLITGLIFALAFAWLLLADNSETRSYREITNLLQNKNLADEQEFIEKCRVFVKNYRSGQHQHQVKNWLWDALVRQADIAERQQKLSQARNLLAEAIRLSIKEKDSQDLTKRYSQIEIQLQKQAREQQLQANLQKIRTLLSGQQLAAVKDLLESTRELAEQLQKPDGYRQAKRLYEEVWQRHRLSRLRFYPAQKLPSASPFESPPNRHPAVARMLLRGRQSQPEFCDSPGHFFAIAAGHLYAINVADASVQWVEYLGGGSLFYPLFIAGPREFYNMALVQKVLVVASAHNAVKMIAVDSGKLIWQKVLPGIITVQPVLYKGKIYVGCLDRYCYRLDVNSGEIEGAYLVAGIPLQPPCFSKQQNLMYLACSDHIYGYDLTSERLRFIMPTPANLAAPVVPVASYLLTFESAQQTTRIGFHLLEPGQNFWQARRIKTASLAGQISVPPTLAGGMLVVTTDTHFAIYGVNPISHSNPDEAFFPLTNASGISLGEKGAIFTRFTNFMRNLLVAQNEISVYQIQEFSSAGAVKKELQYNPNPQNQTPLQSYMPMQRCGEYYFFARRSRDNLYFQGICARISEDAIIPIWQKQLAPAVTTDIVKTADDRLLVTTYDGNIHEIYLNSQGKPCYRILAYQASSGATRPLYIPEQDGYLLLADGSGQLRLHDAVTGWRQNWQSELQINIGSGKPAYARGIVFTGSDNGVFAFSLKTGKKVFFGILGISWQTFRRHPAFP